MSGLTGMTVIISEGELVLYFFNQLISMVQISAQMVPDSFVSLDFYL